MKISARRKLELYTDLLSSLKGHCFRQCKILPFKDKCTGVWRVRAAVPAGEERSFIEPMMPPLGEGKSASEALDDALMKLQKASGRPLSWERLELESVIQGG